MFDLKTNSLWNGYAMSISLSQHEEPHFITRSNWLRAAVLGANDGIVSISALLVGVASATPDAKAVMIAGIAGLVAGAMSMAAGEYVSVSSQSDIERADIEREKEYLQAQPDDEWAELVQIYRARGLSEQTALKVATELTAHDALGAHMRDELGILDEHAANPLQAAFASGVTFSAAAAIPLLGALLAPINMVVPVVLVVTVFALFLLGVLGAKAGGAPVLPAVIRVVLWGIFAMLVTAGIGHFFGVHV